MISSNTVSRFSFTNVILLRFYKNIGCNKYVAKGFIYGLNIKCRLYVIEIYILVQFQEAANIYIKDIVVSEKTL